MTLFIPRNLHSSSILETLILSIMKQDMELIIFSNLQKANDCALWLSFTHRVRKELFVVVHGPDEDYVVMRKSDALELELSAIGPKFHDYSQLNYSDIEAIRIDEDPLKHWEEITGAFATMDGEFLRYILKAKIPLEKFVKYELAIRGYDQNGHWVGFEKAKEIWLK